jgi:hypothetical protein
MLIFSPIDSIEQSLAPTIIMRSQKKRQSCRLHITLLDEISITHVRTAGITPSFLSFSQVFSGTGSDVNIV